jgi:hypothetical protein
MTLITIHVNNALSNKFVYGVTSFYNIDQVSGIGATASAGSLVSSSMTVAITPTHTGAWIMDSLESTSADGSASQTLLYDIVWFCFAKTVNVPATKLIL